MKVNVKFGGHELRQLFESKSGEQLSTYKVAKKMGVSPHTINGLWAGATGQARLSTIGNFLAYCWQNDIDISLNDMFTIKIETEQPNDIK